MSRPFEGLRIVDTTHVLAGPFCTYQFALLGAEVIRVENTDRSRMDMTRTSGGVPELNDEGYGTAFLGQNANKRSIALNLKHPEGKDVLEQLIAQADVMAENFRPGVMERLGFGYQDAVALNPTIIYASLTGYGQQGPLAGAPVYDHIMQAVSGLTSVAGTAEEPRRIPFPLIDYVSGLAGAFAISSALFQRNQTKKPQRIDSAMLDSALLLMTSGVNQVLTGGEVVRPKGNVAASGSPVSGYFQTPDGLLALAANTLEQARRLFGHLGRDDLAADPRLEAWGKHPELGDELTPILAEIFAAKSAGQWEAELSAAGVPAGKVRDLPEVLEHPQTQTRNSILAAGELPELGGSLKVPGVTFTLEHGNPVITSLPPRLGEHTDEILAELGIDAQARAQLREDGAVA